MANCGLKGIHLTCNFLRNPIKCFATSVSRKNRSTWTKRALIYNDTNLSSLNFKEAYFRKSGIDWGMRISRMFSDEKERERMEQKQMDEEELKKREAAWKTVKYTFWGLGATFSVVGAYLIYEWGRPSMDENGDVIEDEFSELPIVQQYLTRLWSKLNYYKKMIREPSREKLLPDPVSHPYIQPPYTLVLELTDVLVHPDWTYQTGWRFKKRPGVDHFLDQVAPPLFEVVVYTAEPGLTVFPILDSLDPNQHIMYRLVRDATHFVDGHHVKDLSRLNRDLSRVIVIDWNSDSVKFHRNNALIIPRWKGNDDDFTLVDLAALLKTIAAHQVDDVRGTLEYYSQFSDPVDAFRENRRRLAEKLEEEQKAEQEKPAAIRGSWSPSFLKKRFSPS